MDQTQLDAIEDQLKTIQAKANTLEGGVASLGSTSGTASKESPVDASTIKEEAMPQVEDVTGEEPEMSTSDAYLESLKATSKGMADMLKTKQDIYAESQKQQQGLLEKLTSRKSAEEYQAETEEKMGFDTAQYLTDRNSDIAELESMQKSYQKMLASKEAGLLAEEERISTTGTIARRMTRTEKEWNIKLNTLAGAINTKNAIISLKDKSYEKASDFIDKAVKNYIEDVKLDYEQFEQYRKDNATLLENMTDDQKAILDSAQEQAKLLYEETKAQKTSIGELIKKYPDAPWPVDALSMTLEEAAATASKSALWEKETMTEEWSDPYYLGGDIVQMELNSGQIRTAVNVDKDSSSSEGTYKSGGAEFTNAEIADAKIYLDNLQLANDYENTKKEYLKMYELWKEDKGDIDDFFKEFPADRYIDIDDNSLPTRFKTELKQYESLDEGYLSRMENE